MVGKQYIVKRIRFTLFSGYNITPLSGYSSGEMVEQTLLCKSLSESLTHMQYGVCEHMFYSIVERQHSSKEHIKSALFNAMCLHSGNLEHTLCRGSGGGDTGM